MADISKPDANPIVAALLTWFVLGLGHLIINGQQRKWMYTLIATFAGSICCVIPGLIIGVCSVVDSYQTAERLKAVRPDLDPAHRPIADAAIRIATSVVDPSVELPPPGDTAPELLAAAFAASYRGALPLALDLSRRGETLFPTDPDFIDLEASIALLLGDRDLLAGAVRRGLAIDPEHPGLLAASAHLKADYLGDLKGAQRDAEHAARLAPGIG